MVQILENWGFLVIQPPGGRYAPPEQFREGFAGRVAGRLVELPIDGAKGENFLSAGSEYQLGEPDPVFEQMFPNARVRMIAQLQQLNTQ